MPFSIHLSSAVAKPAKRGRVDPISGWEMTQFVETGLSNDERRAIIQLLTRKGGHRPGIDDRVLLTLEDATVAEVHFYGLFSNSPCLNGKVTIQDLAMPYLQLVMELAAHARLILRPEGFPRPLVNSEQLRSELLIREPRVQSVFSAAMLWNLLVPRLDSVQSETPAEIHPTPSL